MIRVLQITGSMNYGGAETLLMELYRHMDRKQVQFDFWVYGNHGLFDDEIHALGGKIFYARKRVYREPIAFRKEIIDFVKTHPEYRIVHSHLNLRTGYIFPAIKQADHSVYTIAHSHASNPHSSIKNSILNAVGFHLLNDNTDYYFGCSKMALDAITPNNVGKMKASILNNAIETQKYAFSQNMRARYRRQFGVDENTLVIGNVARFTEEKNHMFMLNVFSELHKKQPNSKLIFVGSGPLATHIERLIAELNLQDSVIMLGVRNDVNLLLSSFDVFLFPSMFEGLGIVAIEAQANGLPCVMSENVIPTEADVGAGLCTRVSLKQNANIWAEKCLNHPLRIDSEISSHKVNEAGYNIDEVTTQLQKFYQEHWR